MRCACTLGDQPEDGFRSSISVARSQYGLSCGDTHRLHCSSFFGITFQEFTAKPQKGTIMEPIVRGSHAVNARCSVHM